MRSVPSSPTKARDPTTEDLTRTAEVVSRGGSGAHCGHIHGVPALWRSRGVRKLTRGSKRRGCAGSGGDGALGFVTFDPLSKRPDPTSYLGFVGRE